MGNHKSPVRRKNKQNNSPKTTTDSTPTVVSGISDVKEAEYQRHQNGRGPKSYAHRERVLQISAKAEFFGEADDDKSRDPLRDCPKDRSAVNAHSGQAKSVQRENGQQANANRRKSDDRTNPEISAECRPRRKPVLADASAFDARHDPRRYRREQEIQGCE